MLPLKKKSLQEGKQNKDPAAPGYKRKKNSADMCTENTRLEGNKTGMVLETRIVNPSPPKILGLWRKDRAI